LPVWRRDLEERDLPVQELALERGRGRRHFDHDELPAHKSPNKVIAEGAAHAAVLGEDLFSQPLNLGVVHVAS
jgi:hypothetical protein